MNYVILLSGGTGSRIKSDIPKQYIEVNGKMIITYSLETIVKSDIVDGVYIVCDSEWQDAICCDLNKYNISLDKVKGYASPGYNRQLSVMNGLEAIFSDIDRSMAMAVGSVSYCNVMIHDAARPLLTSRMIETMFNAIDGHDGVMPVIPMKDTVYYSQDGSQVTSLMDRTKIYAGQAPEVFRLGKYYDANRALLPDKIRSINGSTEPAVMAGMDVIMIPGDENNYKITTDNDLKRFIESR